MKMSSQPLSSAESQSKRRYAVEARTAGAALLLVSVATVLYVTLLRGTPYRIDDYRWIYQRIPGYLDAFAAGQWPPRVFPYAYEGAGYAFPHFYPPVGHWVAAGFAHITNSPVWGVHLAFFAAVILAALTMFELGRRLTGSLEVAFVGAVVYTALPYHFADVVVRGALAEAWAFVWFPVIVSGAASSVRESRHAWGIPLGVCGLMLSHTVLALYFGVGCIAALAWVWTRLGAGKALRLGFSGAVGVAMSLWYLIPTYLDLPGVRASSPDVMRTTWMAVREAATRPGSALFLMDALPWLMLGVSLLYLRGKRVPRPRLVSDALKWLAVAGLVLTLFAYVPALFTPLLPKPFAYIQFPWRVFAITGFIATIALALALHVSQSRRLRALILVAALISGLPFMLFHFGDEPEASVEFRAAGGVTYTVAGDYLPSEVEPVSAAEKARAIHDRLASMGVDMERAGRRLVLDVPQGVEELVLPLHFYPFYRAADTYGASVTVTNRGGRLALVGTAGRVVIFTVNPTPFYLGLAAGMAAMLVFLWARRRERSDGRRGDGFSHGGSRADRVLHAPSTA